MVWTMCPQQITSAMRCKAGTLRPQLNGEANAASQVYPFFHWPLEFPDVFERGGFDVVLGNPPWDRSASLTGEVSFFGTHET